MGEPTWQQITAEAIRRKAQALKDGRGDIELEALIVEITREGWKPPPAVDPDLLAFREWAAGQWPPAANYLYQRGLADNGRSAQAYLAGARMATERERERARWLVEYAVALETFRPSDSTSSIACAASAALAKYRGEA